MKKQDERGQKPPQKKERLTSLIVQAGIAQSVHEARAMLIAGEICHTEKGSEFNKKGTLDAWLHGTPISSIDATSVGSVRLDVDAKVVHRSKCPECARRPLVFAKRNRKPAISSTTHSRVLDEGGCDDSDSHILSPGRASTVIESISQDDLELWILRRRKFREIDEAIAISLSIGGDVEDGVHTAELLPTRDEDGRTYLKVFIR